MTENTLRQRATDVYQHYPRELLLFINGLFAGSQSVNAGKAEQAISVNPAEPITFVEIFSEQGVRLLILDVSPVPPAPVVQTEMMALSDGRRLSVEISFEDRWPELRVCYNDPDYEVPPCCVPGTGPGRHRGSRPG